MNKENAIRLFQDQSIRVQWLPDEEKWVFAVVDVVGVLAESTNPKAYWRKLKERLKKEGNQSVTNIHTLKMPADDGKMRAFDVADTEQLLRLIQSIPSPKAEPFKMWLARVGTERIEETEDPEKAFDRAIETYVKKGYSAGWINQRLKSIEVRKDLTDEWDKRGVKMGIEYAILTDEITRAWSGYSIKEYKRLKDLKKESLRDNMTNLELILNMLAEATTTEISKEKKPQNFEESKKIAHQGGLVAGNTRKEIEARTGKPVISPENARTLQAPNTDEELPDRG
jgi:hypothetical protein